jgi:hypothetical protein
MFLENIAKLLCTLHALFVYEFRYKFMSICVCMHVCTYVM